ncbi:MAG: hypothetical protein C0605_07955 [Hyphomicrobiales bacterium]|nr:MAG: hypothetical protein C0605_07955 [Hyphomicrobiales bacterium]
MKILDSQALADLQSGRYVTRNLVWFDVPEGAHGFWDDVYDLTVSGKVYSGKAGRFNVSDFSSAGGLVIAGLKVNFSSVDSGALAVVQNETWRRQPVTVSKAYLSKTTGAVIAIEQWWSGLIDVVDWDEQPGGSGDLIISAETLSRELNRSGTRTRSDADQRQLDPDDGFFKHVAQSVETNIYWGRKGPE